MNRAPIKIFSGTQSKYIADKIAKSFGTTLGEVQLVHFSDGEFQPYYMESVRGHVVFIIQSTFPPSDNLMELILMIDAAKRASAYKVVAVMPYFGFARQDRKDKPRTSIGAKVVAKMLEAAGLDRLMTMDVHADQIQGFFDIPVDHLYASYVFVPYLKKLNLDNMVIAAPDMGGSKRANAYARFLNTSLAMCYKVRKRANVVEEIKVIGEVKDKDVIIIDDMIDTAGTVTIAADVMTDMGARSVRVMASHPVLSGPAYGLIENSSISEVVVTDSIPLKKKSAKIKVISVADLFAEIITKVYTHQSISTHYLI